MTSRFGMERKRRSFNGTKVATVDLRSLKPADRRVAWVGSWSSSISRTVTIKVLGTKGRPWVDVDGFVVTD